MKTLRVVAPLLVALAACSSSGSSGPSCTDGEPCAPADPCRTGHVACTASGATCVADADAADGTACGAGSVCTQGACVACRAGDACASEDGCSTGTLSCASGRDCVLDATVADGSACAGGVCHQGGCVACVEGDPCTAADGCHSGNVACGTGVPTCVAGSALSDGTSCGTGAVCYQGACNACAQGAACLMPDLCNAGTIDCSTGQPTCAGAVALTNGTSCGTAKACLAGACVAASDVTGSRMATFLTDAAPVSEPASDVGTLGIDALVPRTGGGYHVIPGAFAADGTFRIRGVPTGAYVVRLDHGGAFDFFQPATTTRTGLDLGLDYAGRRDLAFGTRSTPVSLAMTGLVPWTSLDCVTVTSRGAALDAWLCDPITAGATSGTQVLDFLGEGLLDASKGDSAWISHLAYGANADGLEYYASRRWANLTGTTVQDGVAATVPVALAAPASSASVEWLLNGFDAGEATASRAGPGAVFEQHDLQVRAFPSTGTPSPAVQLVWTGYGPIGAGAWYFGQYGWARFLGTGWGELFEHDSWATVTVSAPGATSPYTLRLSATALQAVPSFSQADADACWYDCVGWGGSEQACYDLCFAGTSVRGTFWNVSPTLSGRDASVALAGVGLTPVLAFSGSRADLYEVYAANDGRTAFAWVASYHRRGGSTSFELPDGLLRSGRAYAAIITYESSPSAAPFRPRLQGDTSQSVTGLFSP